MRRSLCRCRCVGSVADRGREKVWNGEEGGAVDTEERCSLKNTNQFGSISRNARKTAEIAGHARESSQADVQPQCAARKKMHEDTTATDAEACEGQAEVACQPFSQSGSRLELRSSESIMRNRG